MDMADPKPILYGVSDFVLMRTKGAYYIDRTALILHQPFYL